MLIATSATSAWNPVKELKDHRQHQQSIPSHASDVESGEGIESDAMSEQTVDAPARVESGEGIESLLVHGGRGHRAPSGIR